MGGLRIFRSLNSFQYCSHRFVHSHGIGCLYYPSGFSSQQSGLYSGWAVKEFTKASESGSLHGDPCTGMPRKGLSDVQSDAGVEWAVVCSAVESQPELW